ncbi:hypothetical protein KGG77_gp13 [Streptomyces phage Omar]|uniref:Uncharacterized protein n=1 Tax=Streptomyces phage Omar TaxID=2059882 RepID=A0A2H5BLW6_9CAUD|nr:hypothetical protein KGG77_gp13 [Streptomyces phage Omar]AUG87255.1 hypothetical protein SEA_OMAR_71 [Streptomyces phage Omar]
MKIPRQLSARVDADLARDIRCLRLAGLSWSQMVKWGVALLANVYRQAYVHRQAPPCTTPILKSFIYAPFDPNHQGPPWITEEETPREDAEVPGQGDRHADRPAGRVLPDLDLAGLGLRAEDAAGQSEVRASVPPADAALL